MAHEYRILPFNELSASLLYDILALRSEVFVLEQSAIYLDPDGLDRQALHVCFMEGDALIGYARLFAPGSKFADASSIGRIVLASTHRKRGLGCALIRNGIEEIRKRYGNAPIRIEAQYDLRDYYGSLGFTIVSDIYDWGGIPHVKMVRAG